MAAGRPGSRLLHLHGDQLRGLAPRQDAGPVRGRRVRALRLHVGRAGHEPQLDDEHLHGDAPGGGDPDNFNINDCSTQRNLSVEGREQAKNIGDFFKINLIPIDKVISSEWCRCKETAEIAFKKFETNNFLNSFFSEKFSKNRKKQIKNLKKYINEWDGNKNLVFVTHYVVISEALNYAPSSGEIVISNIKFKKIGNIKIEY